MRTKSNLTDRATLSLLSLLEDDHQMTQRGLATRIGIALGLTNSLIKRAVRKGLVKVSQAPAKRFAYYITPKGFNEKSRLVGEYLSSSLEFFRQARDEYTSVCQDLKSQGHRRIVLFGAGEISEIATMSARDSEVDVLAIIQLGSNQKQQSEVPVVSNLDEMLALDFDAVVITSADTPQDAYNVLREHFNDEQIFMPPLLHVSRFKAEEDKR
ncbi:MAG: winged helix-turn-helix transcriptional regulator [Magnetovibrio sp.]|nr:winged helix-turn-helix transcriptional regulator [Magnetovibrio sp.]